MANFKLSNPLNLPGPLFVDTTCIDCGTCYHLGEEIFLEKNSSSIVQNQPSSSEEWSKAKAASISCPTHSIGVKNAPEEYKTSQNILPLRITDDVFYCGYTSEASFGATSYLIKREGGNVLVDSPRFHPHLIKEIEKLGGVEWMYLSHKDDVADHEQYAKHFKCKRIIHQNEFESSTSHCEMILEGKGDWQIDTDLKILFTPGHTSGHLCLLYGKDFLFTGDHLFYDQLSHKVYASQNVNWYSWKEQLKSIEKLLPYPFSWIMPGHGGWIHKNSEELKTELLSICSTLAPHSPEL